MGFLGGLWAKIVAIGAIVGAVLLFLARVFKAGADAEKAKTTKAALDHQVKTSEQVSQSDEALSDPQSDRARRVRDRFGRDE